MDAKELAGAVEWAAKNSKTLANLADDAKNLMEGTGEWVGTQIIQGGRKMFFSDKEKEIMEKLAIAIDRNWKNKNERYTLRFSDGSIIETKPFACFESDNALDLDEEGYEEYYSCAMEITKIIADPTEKFKDEKYIEITYHNYPQEITNSKGEKI